MWSGNVRELKNVLEYSFVASLGVSHKNTISISYPGIEPDDLSEDNRQNGVEVSGMPYTKETFPELDNIVLEHIKKALVLSKGKISGKNSAASLLKMHPNTLRSYMVKHDLME